MDNLILMTESEESMCDKIVKWKSGMEVNDLKVNIMKRRIMSGCDKVGTVEKKGIYCPAMCVTSELVII